MVLAQQVFAIVGYKWRQRFSTILLVAVTWKQFIHMLHMLWREPHNHHHWQHSSSLQQRQHCEVNSVIASHASMFLMLLRELHTSTTTTTTLMSSCPYGRTWLVDVLESDFHLGIFQVQLTPTLKSSLWVLDIQVAMMAAAVPPTSIHFPVTSAVTLVIVEVAVFSNEVFRFLTSQFITFKQADNTQM